MKIKYKYKNILRSSVCNDDHRLEAIDPEKRKEVKEIIYDYMKKIAGSDGEVSAEEQLLLNKVRKAFNL